MKLAHRQVKVIMRGVRNTSHLKFKTRRVAQEWSANFHNAYGISTCMKINTYGGPTDVQARAAQH
jgi:hypothetical protein